MGLKDKLERICFDALGATERELGVHSRRLADIVAGVLRERQWQDLSAKVQRELDLAAASAVDAVEVADAAEFVASRVLQADNGRVHDLRLKSDLRVIQEDIHALFDVRDVPKRGFVYVAWSARPERFMYVGKANNVDRLNLATHGKLSHAAAHVSTLSLVFPTQSREELLLGLEASVIRLVEHSTGKMPELNDRRESVPVGNTSEDLHRLGQFLKDVARKVELAD